MGDISTVLWYRGLPQSLWSTGTPRDGGGEVSGDRERERESYIGYSKCGRYMWTEYIKSQCT